MVRLYDASRDENGQVRTYPDGRPLIDQPVKLLSAFRTLRGLFSEG